MKFNLTLLFLLFSIAAFTQVAINGNGANPDGSAMLDINSNNKGLLIPRLTSGERLLIQNPAAGLLVYDKDRQAIYMYDGGEWRPFAFASSNSQQPVMREVKNLPNNSGFGKSVSLYGDYAVVGAPYDTVKGVATGAAYIFHRENGNWKQLEKIYAGNGTAGDWFGFSVDIYKDIMVIGAPQKAISSDAARGRVYVYKLINGVWTPMAGLQATDGKAEDRFGASVAVYENILVAGAPNRDHSNFENAGSVYAFALNNNIWESRGIINAWQNGLNKHFGIRIDFWNYTLAAASMALVVDNVASGGVFTFTTNAAASTWINGQIVEPPSPQVNMQFGFSLSISDEYMLVTAPNYDGSEGSNTGAWYAYKKTAGQWVYYTGEDHPANPAEEMGQSTAIDGARLYIGSPNWSGSKGRVIVLSGYIKELHHQDPYEPVRFGQSVAAYLGDYMVASAQNNLVYFGKIH